MLIRAGHVWLTPVASKEALVDRCSRVLERLNVPPLKAMYIVRYGKLPDKSRAFGDELSTIEEASAAFLAQEGAEFECYFHAEEHALELSASFDELIPSIQLTGGIAGGLSTFVGKYRLSDIIDGLYYFADYPGGPSTYVQNARFFDLLLSEIDFPRPALTSWDSVFAMYRLLNAVLERTGVYERLGLSPAACLERRNYDISYSSYAIVVISTCLKAARANGVDIRDLQEQCVQLTGKTLSEMYEEEYDEEEFVVCQIKVDTEFVEDLAVRDPAFAALLARDVPGFAARLDRARSNKRDGERT
jgi:hypothetical protein